MIGGHYVGLASDKLQEKNVEFIDYFRRHRIYFSKRLCDAITALYEEIDDSATSINWLYPESDGPYDAAKLKEIWDLAYKTIKERGHHLLAQIEEEFRQILGVREP